jgi:trehalose 6-phosphate phosphatase
MPSLDLPDRRSAVFLDFDGTLADLAPHPDAVQLHQDVPALLARLGAASVPSKSRKTALDGAVAVVSGRPIDVIDRHLHPLILPVAGVHGAQRRGADGFVRSIAFPDLQAAAAPIEALCRRHPALGLEHKPGAMALHYRQAPQLEDECLAAMSQALGRVDGMMLLHGKMVIELKPRLVGKDTAVRSFMDEPPFHLRRPWFFGDDVTDEAAFECVQALGGVAVKIGEGETLAGHRLRDPAALLDWLVHAAGRLDAMPLQQVR